MTFMAHWFERITDWLGSLVFNAIAIVILLAIPIAELVIGLIYKDECQIEPNIPLYLIVAGGFGIALAVSRLIQSSFRGCGTEEQQTDGSLTVLSAVDSLIAMFLWAWFIAGCVWVYSNFNEADYNDVLSPDYCDYVVYHFTFWILNVTFIIMGLFFLLGITSCGVAGFLRENAQSKLGP